MDFFNLTPEKILEASESIGLKPTGRVLALNSVENRVFEVELEGAGKFVVLKFYRPGRWSYAQIKEEHEFMFTLSESEIPIIVPTLNKEGRSIHEKEDIYFCSYLKQGGRLKDELDGPTLERLGRLIGRMHAVGATLDFDKRRKMTPETFGDDNFNYLTDNKVLPPNLESRFLDVLEQIIDHAYMLFEYTGLQPIHGDLHSGNLIWRNEDVFLVDFDDSVVGPPVQDFWLLIAGRDDHAKKAREQLINGYNTMNNFHPEWLSLIEPLRALRMLHFICWIHKRWDDPSFPKLFPNFGSEKYWQEQLEGFYEIGELLEGA